MSLPRFSVENHVLVNMMMLVLLVSGAGFAFTLVREMFPESRPDQIEIRAIYPAAQLEELQKAVTIKIEESLEDVDGIEKINSTVVEGMSSTVVTLYNEVKNLDAVLQEIDTEVHAIEDLPDDLEKLTVRKLEPTLPVISVSLFGEGSESDRKKAARDLRDELLKLPGVSRVQKGGIRDDEISVEIRPDKLLEYDVTFQEVASAIRGTNLDISGGTLKGDKSNTSVRTLGEELKGMNLGDIEIRSDLEGRKVLVSDVALIRDDFVENDTESYFNGAPAVNLTIQKTSSQDAIQIADLVRAYIAGKRNAPFDPYGFHAAREHSWYVRPFSLGSAWMSWAILRVSGRPDPMKIYEESRKTPFTHNFEIGLHSDLSRFVRGRLDLMARNGISGLVLVMISLLLFLNWRVALWSAIGLPVSFMGTFLLMWVFGVSINLLSMFGLIIVLGIIVDDAIVIGENIYRHIEEGMPAREAAIKGAEEVMWPVIVAVITTIAAFLPLMFIKGRIGDFMRELPLVVIAALSVSLIEAILILPAHLSRLPPVKKEGDVDGKSAGILGLFGRIQTRGSNFMNKTLVRAYELFLTTALKWRYATVAIALSSLILSLGLFASGAVKSEFIQKMDSETIIAQLDMPVGTVLPETRERLQQVSQYLLENVPEVENVQMHVGVQLTIGGTGSIGAKVQSYVGQLIIELREGGEREKRNERSSSEILAELREYTAREVKGINALTWEAFNGGPAGKDIELQVSGDDFNEIVTVTSQIMKALNTYDGVVDLEDDYDLGKREIELRLFETARPTGITVQELGQSIRYALYGVEAQRLTRNREDVKIMVRYPRDFRKDVYNIETMWVPVRNDNNGNANSTLRRSNRRWVPLKEIAHLTENQAASTIHRSERKQSITVFGEVDSAVTNLESVLKQFHAKTLTQIKKEHPNIRIQSLGTSEERAKSFGSLVFAFPIALMMIYMLLAGLFRSYLQPFVVMSAIPFGLEGALIGHWITGTSFTILSQIGLVALAGILVNDSLVLVDFINSRVKTGLPVFEASLEGSKLRLRPILLTTITTAAGLTPLMFETSFQAKFLIPMAVTLTFGLIFATVLTLIIVPSLNLIFFDISSMFVWFRRHWKGESDSSSEEAIPQPSAPLLKLRE